MSRNDVRRFLVAHDIASDRRREQLAKCLERHGDRIQYSVFVVDASPARMVRLRAEISVVLRAQEDSVLICDLGLCQHVHDGRFEFLGRSRPITAGDFIVV
jgi:CRISPR-associated protein Cas2